MKKLLLLISSFLCIPFTQAQLPNVQFNTPFFEQYPTGRCIGYNQDTGYFIGGTAGRPWTKQVFYLHTVDVKNNRIYRSDIRLAYNLKEKSLQPETNFLYELFFHKKSYFLKDNRFYCFREPLSFFSDNQFQFQQYDLNLVPVDTALWLVADCDTLNKKYQEGVLADAVNPDKSKYAFRMGKEVHLMDIKSMKTEKIVNIPFKKQYTPATQNKLLYEYANWDDCLSIDNEGNMYMIHQDTLWFCSASSNTIDRIKIPFPPGEYFDLTLKPSSKPGKFLCIAECLDRPNQHPVSVKLARWSSDLLTKGLFIGTFDIPTKTFTAQKFFFDLEKIKTQQGISSFEIFDLVEKDQPGELLIIANRHDLSTNQLSDLFLFSAHNNDLLYQYEDEHCSFVRLETELIPKDPGSHGSNLPIGLPLDYPYYLPVTNKTHYVFYEQHNNRLTFLYYAHPSINKNKNLYTRVLDATTLTTILPDTLISNSSTPDLIYNLETPYKNKDGSYIFTGFNEETKMMGTMIYRPE